MNTNTIQELSYDNDGPILYFEFDIPSCIPFITKGLIACHITYSHSPYGDQPYAIMYFNNDIPIGSIVEVYDPTTNIKSFHTYDIKDTFIIDAPTQNQAMYYILSLYYINNPHIKDIIQAAIYSFFGEEDNFV